MKVFKKVFLTAATVFVVAVSCTTRENRLVAIVADSGVIEHNAEALANYAASIEANGIKTCIIEDV